MITVAPKIFLVLLLDELDFAKGIVEDMGIEIDSGGIKDANCCIKWQGWYG